MSRMTRRAWMVMALCALLALEGCIILPVRVRSKTRTATAGDVRKKVETEFLKPGTTTRQEVMERLGWIDTGVREERYFFGRWLQSKWGVFVGVGGYGAGAADWERIWKPHNLMIDFDDKGVVRSVSSFPDKVILEALSARAGEPAAGLTLEVPAGYRRGAKAYEGKLRLSGAAFSFLCDEQDPVKTLKDFRTPWTNLREVKLLRWGPTPTEPAMPGSVSLKFEFKEKVAMGRKLEVKVAAADVPEVARYFALMEGKRKSATN